MFFRFALSRTPAIPIGVIPSPAFVRRRIRTRIRCGSQKLGLGANVPLAMTNGGEAVTALVNGKFVVIRIYTCRQGAIQDSISYAVYLALKAKAESVARGTGLSEVDG